MAPVVSLAAPSRRRPRILLRSSWMVVNIGDIAHTPGVLALLQQHLPEVEVRLWASANLTAEVAAMLRRRFPGLVIVKGTISDSGEASSAELAEALAWCDFLLHGSGPSLVAARDVTRVMPPRTWANGIWAVSPARISPGRPWSRPRSWR